jgi:dienelactone hydrolase
MSLRRLTEQARAARASLCWLAVLAGMSRVEAQTTSQPVEAPVVVRFPVRDSIVLVADVYRAAGGAGGPTILLFHQAGGSARGEYRAITPRLVHEGYNVIASDIRGGGDRFGVANRVATPDPAAFSYCEALAEMDAAVNLARVQGFSGPLVLWGSSYSATLALQVGARRAADVRAVLAFSPASGEPMSGCEPAVYVGWLTRAGVPTLALRPRAELEDPGRAAAFEAMRRDGAAVHVAERGRHGSSMLDAERTQADTEPEWKAVLAFLRHSLEPRPASPGERPVSIPSDGWTLRGDLRLPRTRPAPLVVLLHKAAGDRRVFRDLAERLAAAGIGSLRVDLRGHGASVDRGRFVPGQTGDVLDGTARDVAAIWRFVHTLPGVDTARLGMVSGSYSSQAAALAGQGAGYGLAAVALSPGDFSDESFRAAAGSGASWLFVRSDNERFVREWLDAKVRELAPGAELWVVPAGSAHATDLLAADATFAPRLTAWLAARLTPADRPSIRAAQ